ncbi:hypothetical protein BGZ60DRAFT_526503 [Tricladium varicosporioides]|nr:hypothetical protein BGZ60DRAFT_526503 [Hymenoscyphus varicosporioides]
MATSDNCCWNDRKELKGGSEAAMRCEKGRVDDGEKDGRTRLSSACSSGRRAFLVQRGVVARRRTSRMRRPGLHCAWDNPGVAGRRALGLGSENRKWKEQLSESGRAYWTGGAIQWSRGFQIKPANEHRDFESTGITWRKAGTTESESWG